MAHAAPNVVRLPSDSAFECPICSETYNHPISLPCHHSFCENCIGRYCSGKQRSDEKMSCPLCKKQFQIPVGGVQYFPRNVFLEEMIALRESLGFQSGERNKISERPRNAQKLEKRKARSINLLVAENAIECDKHPTVELTLYCSDCKAPMCWQCEAGHQGHAFVDLRTAATKFEHQAKHDVECIKETMQICREVTTEMDKEKADCRINAAQCRREILQQAEQLKRRVEQEKNKLLSDLASHERARMEHLRSVDADIEEHLSSSDHLIKLFGKVVRRKARASDFVRQWSTLEAEGEELKKCKVIERALNELGSTSISFFAAESSGISFGKVEMQQYTGPPRRSTAGKMLRTLQDCKDADLTDTSDDEEWQLSPNMSAPVRITSSGIPITGITILNDKLYVARHQSKGCIEVYDALRVKLKQKLFIKDFSGSASCLVSCTANSCVYISDCAQTVCSIHRLDTSTDVLSVSRWPVDESPAGLSVTSGALVLVTICGNQSSKICEYTTHGGLVRNIMLDPDVVRPSHALLLLSGQFVVSHGAQADPLHRVCLVDGEGRVVASYGNRNGSATGQLNGPRHLAVIKNTVLVTDRQNNRIMTLSEAMQPIRRLAVYVDGGFQEPSTLCWNESHGHLYVGEYMGGRILKFDNVV